MAVALMTACGGNKNEQENKPEEEAPTTEVTLTEKQMSAVGIALGQMDTRRLGHTIRANGRLSLDPQNRAEVSPLMGGVVRSITVNEGNRVGRGQTVAYVKNIDIIEIQKNYLTAYTETEAALVELQRQKLLSSQGAGVKKTLQQARTAYSLARAQMAGLSRQLQQLGISPRGVSHGRFVTRMPVKSPISGVVGKIKVNTGSYVDMQTSLMTVTDNRRMHCDLNIFERDIPSLRIGQNVDMRLTGNHNVRLSGRIYEINSAMDEATKSIVVHVSLPSAARERLMPDMFVTGIISTGDAEVKAMPDEAIVSKNGRKYIYLLVSRGKGNVVFRPVEVATGTNGLGYTAVTPVETLPPDSVFVKKGAFYISSIMDGESEE